MARNLDLLRSREWIDIPLVYANQRRAILAIAKGADGNSAFTRATAATTRTAAGRPCAFWHAIGAATLAASSPLPSG